jgi:hypothetical protein
MWWKIIGIKLGATVRGGLAGGVVAGAALAIALLLAGESVRTLAWLSAAVVAFGIGIAFACALVSEYITHDSGWTPGALVGLALGLVGSSAVGVVPWAAWQLGYRYLPPSTPLHAAEPALILIAVAACGVLSGAVASAWYGEPRHASQPPPPRWELKNEERRTKNEVRSVRL